MQDATKIDSFWMTKVSDGFLTIFAPIGTANEWIYIMVLRMTSISNATDTATKDFNFVVTIQDDCTQIFIDPTITSPFTYLIRFPVVSETITFTGLSNNNCLFDTTLSLSIGGVIDSSVFTYTNEVLI